MGTFKERCTFGTLPRTTRGVPLVLGGDPKGQKFLYTNGNCVVIRDIEDPAVCELYTEHQKPATVAKFSPSRFYIASGDQGGKVRIWDTVNKEHILKNEFPVLGGAIKDIAWDPESKRIAICGEGRESFAKVITADSGNTIGDISGQTKSVNSVAYKPNRPFRIVTASEDFAAQYFEGPPFKFKETKKDHSNFVQSVRFSPTGDYFVTAGSDCKAFVYDGKTGAVVGALGGGEGDNDAKAHKGGIYAIDFSPDGSELLTVSGDKTAKIWNVASRQCVVEFVMGKDISDMQLGCLWQGDNILTVSLSGFVNYLDRNNPTTPRKILKGHNKPISSIALSTDRSTLYSGGTDGQIFYWDTMSGVCDELLGKGHSNKVMAMVTVQDSLLTVSMDDTLRITSTQSNQYSASSTKMPSQPLSVAAMAGGVAVITCMEHIVVVDRGNVMFEQKVTYEPCSVDIHPGRGIVAVGGKTDSKLHIFELSGNTLREITTLPFDEEPTQIRYSPDGAHMIASGSQRTVKLYAVNGPEHKLLLSDRKHNSRVNTVAWTPDSQHFASSGVDTDIYVYNLSPDLFKNKVCHIKAAHKKSEVTKLEWLSDNILISCGADSCITQWEISFQ